MRMLLEADEHADFLESLADPVPDEVIISTFGLYAGISFKDQDITSWGPKFQSRTRDLLEMVRGSQVKLLVGVSEFTSCKPKNKKCIPCEMRYAKQLLRLVSHADFFPEFEWKMTHQLHLKCNIFRSGNKWRGVAGGRNFTGSDWADVSFELAEEQIKVLKEHTMELWQEATTINSSTVQEILHTQNISKQAMVALVNG